MVLLNGCGNHAGDADAVAAHAHHLITAIFTLNGGFQRVRILGAELEDVTHFDAAFNLQCTFAIRA